LAPKFIVPLYTQEAPIDDPVWIIHVAHDYILALSELW